MGVSGFLYINHLCLVMFLSIYLTKGLINRELYLVVSLPGSVISRLKGIFDIKVFIN